MAGTSPLFRKVIQADFVAELEELGIVFPEEIGSGTFSAVFHAWLLPNLEDPDGGVEPHEVAIKLVWDDVTERRLLKEAQMLHRLAGLHFCADLIAVRRLSMGSVLVTPYVEADSFETLSCGSIPPKDAKDGGLNPAGQASHCLGWAGIAVYARRLLEALAHTHSRGIIHRDVKPRNFLFQARTGNAYLIDYGLAQSTEEQLHKANRIKQMELRSASRLYLDVAERVLADGIDQEALDAIPRSGLSTATNGDISTEPTSDLSTAPAASTSSSVVTASSPMNRAVRITSQAAAASATAGLARRKPRGDRAGTPGFRPPEVLMTVPEQGPGVDIWAAGVILATMTARRCPLLPGKEDGMQLAMISALVGPERVARAAERQGKAIVVAPLGGIESPMMMTPSKPTQRGDERRSSASVSLLQSASPQTRVAGALPLVRGRMLLSEADRDARLPSSTSSFTIPPVAAVYGDDSDSTPHGRVTRSAAATASSSSSTPPESKQHVAVPEGVTIETVEAALSLSWSLPLVSALPNVTGADRTRISRLIPQSRVQCESDHAIALQCVDLLAGMLDPDPLTRLSAAAALSHPFLSPLGALSASGASGMPVKVIKDVITEAEPHESPELAATSAALTSAAKMLEVLESNMALV